MNFTSIASYGVISFFSGLYADFYSSIFEAGRWKYYLTGIINTLSMSVMACILGVIIALFIAIIKVTNANTGKLKALNWLANIYTTLIRGTPMLVQLLIIWFIVFRAAPYGAGILVASLAFGLNSGAYVSEIIRAGIQSVDRGQTEAGRSLGLSSGQTMRLIILPQAIKNILPALFNEFITLVKETSVASYIAIEEITKAGDIIRSRSFNTMPLLISAALYLIIVLILTRLQQMLERRLSAGDNR